MQVKPAKFRKKCVEIEALKEANLKLKTFLVDMWKNCGCFNRDTSCKRCLDIRKLLKEVR